MSTPEPEHYDAIVLAVAHNEFRELGAAGIRQWGRAQDHVLYDLKTGQLGMEAIHLPIIR